MIAACILVILVLLRQTGAFKVIYTDYMPARFAGYTVGPVILIRPSYRDDRGLLEHEKTHVHQFWNSWGLMGLRYWLSPAWRQRYEVEAYQVQLIYSPGDAGLFAGYLSANYGLDLPAADALKLLTE